MIFFRFFKQQISDSDREYLSLVAQVKDAFAQYKEAWRRYNDVETDDSEAVDICISSVALAGKQADWCLKSLKKFQSENPQYYGGGKCLRLITEKQLK